jgi:hypothetical protein
MNNTPYASRKNCAPLGVTESSTPTLLNNFIALAAENRLYAKAVSDFILENNTGEDNWTSGKALMELNRIEGAL